MKLSTKILTSLTPIAIVGSITPAIVSCSKHEYIISYGDNINCKDKKGENYHNLKSVKGAITNKLNFESDEGKEINIDNLNNSIKTDTTVFQNIYYEYVYYLSNTNTAGFVLTGWTGSQADAKWNFTIEGQEFHDANFQYASVDNKIYLQINSGEIQFESYTYKLCVPQE